MKLKTLYRALIAAVIVLMVVGPALVLSASSTYSALKFHDDFYHMFIRHLIKVGIAILCMFAFAFIPYKYFRVFSKKAIMGMAVLLGITFLMGAAFKGASRWLTLGPLSLQPSEIAKIFLLVHVAYLVESKGEEIKDFKKGFRYPVIWIVIIAGLVFVQPNVSTSIIITATAFMVLFVGGARLWHMFATLTSLGAAAGVFAMIFRHSRERILTFVESFGNGGHINTQVAQAKIALGSGGFFGIGLGHSRQSDLFLPESYGDFIFSILGEELGYIGVVGILLVYLLIFIVGILIAKKAADQFSQLLAFGISFMIILSAFTNAAVVTGLAPTTGIPLPFISYGGTSVVLMCVSVGILVNIAMTSNKLQETKKAAH